MNRLLDLKTQIDRLVQTELPSAIPEAVDADIEEVIREFFSRTACWRASLGPFSRPKNTPYVFLGPPVGTVINLVHEVLFNNYPLGPRVGSGYGWVWAVDRPELLSVYPISDQDQYRAYIVTASLIPTSLDAEVPQATVSHHLGTIVAGCLARLYGQANKPWYTPVEAGVQRKLWTAGMAAAKIIGYRGFAPATLQAQNPYGTFA